MLTEKLLNAARTGEVLRIRYFGGSTSGAERQLRSIAIADGKVRALCLQSGETKSFVIEKMEEVLDGVPSAMAAVIPVAPTTFSSVEEFVNWNRHQFESIYRSRPKPMTRSLMASKSLSLTAVLDHPHGPCAERS